MPDDSNKTNNNQNSEFTTVNTSDFSPMSTPPPPTTTTPDKTASELPSTQPQTEPSQNTASTQTEEAPTSQNDPSALITTPSQGSKKSAGKKVVATIFGVLFLIGGVAAGVFLVQRQQNLEERASSGAACDQSPNCVLFDNPGNTGSESVTKTIEYLDITNKPGEERRYYPGQGGDSCYDVSINGSSFTWNRIGDGPGCRDISNIQVWVTDDTTPDISASCSEVTAYDNDWNPLTMQQLSQLSAGETVKFVVSGTSSNGTIDKARFRVNSSDWQESSDLKPGEANTFYINYTIPDGVTSFTVNGQVHLVETDNWY